MKIYSDTTLPYIQEYFLKKKTIIQSVIIWIITLLLFIFFIFISFAPFEEVIKVNGFIRPKKNISTVSNAITGRIKSITYKTGQFVQKGQLLLEIDPSQLEADKTSILSQIFEVQHKLEALYEIQDSINKNQNNISNTHFEASLRFDLWRINLEKLANIKNLNSERFLQEKKLPNSMTTISKLKELETQYNISCNDYDNYFFSFQHEIEKEIISYETTLKINNAKLSQIEDSLLFTKIKAPINGFIQEISTFNQNDWIQSGQELFNIIPIEKNSTKIELGISAKQAGKIQKGMKVKMRFPSLPYHEFGGTDGEIITIEPDITRSQNGEAYFIVETSINKNVLIDKKGRQYPLKVGLAVDARIIDSKKTILNFILEKLNLWY